MANEVIPVSVKATAAAYALEESVGASFNVSEVCRDEGVSRSVFYKWAARVRAEGMDGLEERSRRPHTSPQQTSVEVEDEVVRWRKELGDAGLDHGATSIHWHLTRQGDVDRVPSVATIHRILVRRGLVAPQPHKAPKATWRRFEAAAPNELWQIDHTDWVIATGAVKIFNIVDDHSRVAISSRAVTRATSEEAWRTYGQGAQIWGLPAGNLSDNGLCFSGKVRHAEVFFEAQLRDAGVQPITGLAEAIQQTLKRGGIELEILPGDGKQTLTKYRARTHDIYIGTWGADYWDPHTNADTFARNPDNNDDAKSKPLAWRNAWAIPDLTKKSDAAVLERDGAKRKAMYDEIQAEFRKTSPFVMLFQQIEVAAFRANVENLKIGPTSDSTYMFRVSKR